MSKPIPLLNQHELSRRKLLCWTPPLVAAVMLPAHAQTSVCISAPVMRAAVASKCSGSPPIGQAVVTVFSDGADPADDQIEIRSIVVSGTTVDDTLNLPALPANVINSLGVDIEWTGPASDAVTCLPTSDISFAVTYGCAASSMDETANFDLITGLADAIP